VEVGGKAQGTPAFGTAHTARNAGFPSYEEWMPAGAVFHPSCSRVSRELSLCSGNSRHPLRESAAEQHTLILPHRRTAWDRGFQTLPGPQARQARLADQP